MTTTIEAAVQLAELDGRIDRLRRTMDALTSRRADAERTLARAIADGAPEQERRALSDAVEQLDRDRAGIPEALDLLEAERPPLLAAAHQARQNAADAEAERLQGAYAATFHEAHDALQAAARDYLVEHRRMNDARSAAIEARRVALRLAGADRMDVFHAQPDEPNLADDGDFHALARLLALYGSAL